MNESVGRYHYSCCYSLRHDDAGERISHGKPLSDRIDLDSVTRATPLWPLEIPIRLRRTQGPTVISRPVLWLELLVILTVDDPREAPACEFAEFVLWQLHAIHNISGGLTHLKLPLKSATLGNGWLSGEKFIIKKLESHNATTSSFNAATLSPTTTLM